MFKSREFFVKLKGNYALFTNPSTKGGGEKATYTLPTKQALQGCVDSLYFKPTFRNVITEVKVINQIQTEVIGTRALLGSGKVNTADLNYVSYLTNVEYLVRFYMTWNEERPDLINDRNQKKHEAIMERSIKKGGRRDIFLGTRECVATAEYLTREEYEQAESEYDGKILSMGIMFQEFEYPTEDNQPLKSYFADVVMKDGVIQFKKKENCEIVNTLSTYNFKNQQEIKSVDKELEEYDEMETR
ncbi:type I-C CRISPR-associated protein Cas5c [Tetragenococcus koreensis]|uniref:pre-crRNA processing endonuclease n=1 Tax=Tetragenococcus koreensis TaxID=290335 RepID=A0AAN4UB13_9ENTE|nr:type I-C CRISPR-associated protein Cas5c [Tetragenococcus koreensis]AYW46546.1 type I-C CRISPR-associated protein Cas5 [Tetragenococcus koreensis]MCF1585643.1 type I-C CRISPR-associated protein Cas5c [Tetragenococcus koreensis]MCF1615245.1 type I-C CRISPR-associated protein Cas5c [Tetragenococcus koreensis]MCF1617506.1 type I-C CRISPR-associated protein Cas5c [Tetragenococcus koreensis]MCF1620280.1 type I-C CRISPR-associated protein Cas5c [Tetragenococcus koreensis]